MVQKSPTREHILVSSHSLADDDMDETPSILRALDVEFKLSFLASDCETKFNCHSESKTVLHKCMRPRESHIFTTAVTKSAFSCATSEETTSVYRAATSGDVMGASAKQELEASPPVYSVCNMELCFLLQMGNGGK